MKILTIVSGLDFRNHTRRSTLAAIHKLNPEMDVLLYNSVRNYFKSKNIEPGIRFYYYHFWVFENLRKYRFLPYLEHLLRGPRWKAFFNKYNYIFIIDPNQYYLLQFIDTSHILIYLLRDPSILQNPSNYRFEFSIIKRANAILAISENLRGSYFRKHYGFQPSNVYLWSNSVDLELWNYSKYPFVKKLAGPVVGMAGNINKNTDLHLLKYLLSERPNIRFEIAGKLKLDQAGMKFWEELLEFKNLYYHGYIPFAEVPGIVSQWDVGLLIESKDNEYSSYYNHNKIYQYMALGKPFVSYNYNSIISKFKDVAFVGQSHAEYAQMIDLALKRSKFPKLSQKGLEYAIENSTKKRAVEFLGILNKLS